MGSTKKDQYTKNQLNYARIGRAIAAPARVVILQQLYRHTFVANKDLVQCLKLSDSTVQQHLQILKESGFISENFIHNRHAYFLSKRGTKDIEYVKWLVEDESAA